MVTPYYYPVIGGTERVIEQLSTQLSKKGIYTDIITINFSQTIKPLWRGAIERTNGLTIKKVPAIENPVGQKVYNAKYILGPFINLLDEYDILHFHNDVDLTFPIFSYFVRKHKIFHMHCLFMTYTSYKKNCIKRTLLKKLTHLYIAASKQIMNFAIELGIPEEKIKVIPNGVDTSKFKPCGKKDKNLILFVGRIVKQKGVDTLINSLRYLRDRVHLIIIGPPGSDIQYYRSILELIEKQNKGGRHEIKYLGAVEDTELVKWYQRASLFVLPSIGEGFPVTLLEALACETPVVATPVGDVPEVVKNYTTGILIDENCPKCLSRAIEFLLKNDDQRIKMGKEGLKLIKEKFSIEIISEKLIKIYKQLISTD